MKKQRKIGIFAGTEHLEEEILRALLDSQTLDPVCFDSLSELENELQWNRLEGAVLGIEEISPHFIDQVEKKMRSFPISIVSPSFSSLEREKIGYLSHVFAVQFPKELKDLSGGMNHFFDFQTVSTRMNHRQLVNLQVVYKTEQKQGLLKVTDLSSSGIGGLLLEGDLNAGEILKLRVPIIHKTEAPWIEAKVVWEKCEGKNPQRKIGLSFAA